MGVRVRRWVLGGALWVCLGCSASGHAPLGHTSGSGSDVSERSDSGTGDAGGTAVTSEALAFAADPEVTRYPSQPMIADIRIETTRPAEVELSHSDAGVVFEDVGSEGDGTVHDIRIRGLAPETAHSVTVRLVDITTGADGPERRVDFTTTVALPGYVERFEVDDRGGSLAPYRLFDLAPMNRVGPSGLFVVDAAGQTRWHLGTHSSGTRLEQIHAGVKVRADGSLLYLHENRVKIRDELGNTVLDLSAEVLGVGALHHDVIELPSGNFAALAYSFREIDFGGVVGPLYVTGDQILEFNSAGEVLWTWDTFDHLDPGYQRAGFELLIDDPATGRQGHDWTHGNGLVYVEEDDAYNLSLRHQDWILKIDRASGELEWRLGDGGDFSIDGDPGEAWFFHPHSPQWQSDASLLLYDNGVGNPYLEDSEEVARVVRYAVDEVEMRATLLWEDDGQMYRSPVAGDADVIGDGPRVQALDSSREWGLPFDRLHSVIRELDPDATPMEQWSLRGPQGSFIYRALPLHTLFGAE